MEISPTTLLSPSGADAAGKSLAKDFDNFLILLTTQLQNQDPLEPLDSNEFTAQLVRFTNVEQAISQNKKLEKLVEIIQASEAAAAVGYLGKTIEAVGSDNQLVNGSAQWGYSLAEPSASTAILVKDSAGKVVFSTDDNTTAAKHSFTWDGKNTNGELQPDGVYEIQVTASDVAGSSVVTATAVKGVVTGVESSNGEHMLAIGGAKVSLGSVLAVTQG